jgi:nucleotide-binding universal stress UspA family protein
MKMVMTKSILCPIDFSKSSEAALKWAAELSAILNYHLTILYPYRLLQSANGDAVHVKKKNEEQASKQFADLEKKILKGKNISFDFSPEVGFMNDRVDYHLKKEAIVIMVISKSMNLNNENTEDFIGHANVPVLVVP